MITKGGESGLTHDRQKKKTGHSAERNRFFVFTEWLLLLTPFLFGLFFPWTSAVVSLLCIGLLFTLLKKGSLCFSSSPAFLTASSIVLFHLGGILWGTDHGMALVGAVQFLPLPLFVLLLEQHPAEERTRLLRKVPYVASVMVLLSLLMSIVVPTEGWFLVSGRQAGFFQYPNTYAVYLLFAVVLVLFGEPLRLGPVPWLVVLMAGILLSGSRTVLVLLVGVLVVFFIREKRKNVRRNVLALAGSFVILAALYVIVTGKVGSVVGRLLTISVSASEFLGRLLYAGDALPVILTHPLGLGYSGYRWLQGSFQTGVYFVQHAHNELIQMLLDVGWIPAGLFLWTLWKSLRSPVGGFCRKMLVVVLLLHCLLDFDTQFVAVSILLFLVLDVSPQATRLLKLRAIVPIGFILAASFSLWIGFASFFYYLQEVSVATRIYPAYTEALVTLLPSAPAEEAERLADLVLRLNDSVAGAHDTKARSAFYAGDMETMVLHKQEAIRLSRYQLWEYLDYFDALRYSYERCLGAGDEQGAARYLSLLEEIPGMLEDVKAQTSSLGWRIKDQPELDLPPEYTAWLNAHAKAS